MALKFGFVLRFGDDLYFWERNLPGITDITWKKKEMHKIMAVPFNL